MSGAERVDIASAQLRGLSENESENTVFASVHIEASLVDSGPACTNSAVRETDRHVSLSGYGEGLELTLNAKKELGMLDNTLQSCTSVMGNRMPNCDTAQKTGDSLTPVNVVTEQLPAHNDVVLTCEQAKESSETLNCGDAETMGNSVSLSEPYLNKSESCETMRDCEAQGEKCVSLMQAATGGHGLSQETQTIGPPQAGKPIGQDSVSNELLHPNVELPNAVEPGLINGVVTREIAIGLPCKLTNVSTCPGALQPNLNPDCMEQHLSRIQGLSNQPLNEKIGAQSQNDSLVQDNPVDDTCNNQLAAGVDKPVQSSNAVLSSIVSDRVPRAEEAPEIVEGNRESVHCEQVELKEEAISKNSQAYASGKQLTESNLIDGEHTSLIEEVERSNHKMSKNSCGTEQPAASDTVVCYSEQRRPPCNDLTRKQLVVVLAAPATSANTNTTTPKTAIYEKSRRGRKPGKISAVVAEKKYGLRSSVENKRASCSSSQLDSDAPQPSTIFENSKGSTGRRGRKPKLEMKGRSYDEFIRMRKHLRYLLHRIRYEQNLLDAYSSEGWRGQSLEKLRPEKELQRAKADINRSKLKIRDLFQRLDSISTEGKFPESLYDSDGLIDSEDIFCAKCGSKDLSPGNDIILCDGVCERGFHQYCLEPPLRSEEIPPGDEGWLCPACDCKVDCLDLLKDYQERKLTIEDSWEKVFPEAAAVMSGNEQDDIMGLPSDDSDDNDFDPDGSDGDDDDDVKVEGSEESSDESDSSDFSSASEDLGAIAGNQQNLGLPSDDSEDDDYDPDAANVNDDVENEASSSDFTSASEDLGAAVDNGEAAGELEPTLPLEQVEDILDSPTVSGRRHVERLDYKKLYDETYGNAASDSSDDEEWADVETTTKGKRGPKKSVSVSANADASKLTDNTSNMGTPRRRGRKKLNPCVANGSTAQPTERSPKPGSDGKNMKKPPYNRLGDIVTQRLYEAFKENQYPDRPMKEKLASELGLTPEKVNKWFGNARWSFNHHRARIESSMATVASRNNAVHNDGCNGTVGASADVGTSISKDGATDLNKLDTKESDDNTSAPRRGRKRKKTEDDQPILQSSTKDTSIDGQKTEHGERQNRRRSGAQ